MLDLARRALANAHAPYSGLRVGACMRAASGRLYAGCNVENVSYGLTQCAETTAIGAMVAAGDREIVEVVVLTERAGCARRAAGAASSSPSSRAPQVPIHLCGPQGVRLTTTLGELLPLAFGPGAFERTDP